MIQTNVTLFLFFYSSNTYLSSLYFRNSVLPPASDFPFLFKYIYLLNSFHTLHRFYYFIVHLLPPVYPFHACILHIHLSSTIPTHCTYRNFSGYKYVNIFNLYLIFPAIRPAEYLHSVSRCGCMDATWWDSSGRERWQHTNTVPVVQETKAARWDT